MNNTSASAIQQCGAGPCRVTPVENTEQQACSVERAAEPGGKPHPALAYEPMIGSRGQKSALLHPEPVELSIEQPHRRLQPGERGPRVEGIELAEGVGEMLGWSDTAR